MNNSETETLKAYNQLSREFSLDPSPRNKAFFYLTIILALTLFTEDIEVANQLCEFKTGCLSQYFSAHQLNIEEICALYHAFKKTPNHLRASPNSVTLPTANSQGFFSASSNNTLPLATSSSEDISDEEIVEFLRQTFLEDEDDAYSDFGIGY